MSTCFASQPELCPRASQRVALALPDEEIGQALLARLKALGIQTPEIIDQGLPRNFLLLDNIGLLLESLALPASGQ